MDSFSVYIINEDNIKAQSKLEFKKENERPDKKKAAFQYLLEEQKKHSKLNQINYSELKIQPYLIKSIFNKEERKLMVKMS